MFALEVSGQGHSFPGLQCPLYKNGNNGSFLRIPWRMPNNESYVRAKY